MQKTGEKGYPPNARTSMLDVGGIRKGIDDAGNLDVCGGKYMEKDIKNDIRSNGARIPR